MKKSGDELFYFDSMPQDFSLSDFWSWFSSDLLNNTTRGILAEFIVAKALGLGTNKTRDFWGPFDLLFDGTPVEVKSSAYIQSITFGQEENKLSTPIFGIAPTHSYGADGNIAFSRKAKIYVFCLLGCKDREQINPMKLEQWQFFVVPTSILDEKCGAQKTISLSALASLKHTETDYYNLKATVEKYAEVV